MQTNILGEGRGDGGVAKECKDRTDSSSGAVDRGRGGREGGRLGESR